MKRSVYTPDAPQPQGTYEQAVCARGEMVFISGQTPRRADGSLLEGASFEEKAAQAMDNLDTVARAAGCNLADHCVKVTVYLKNLDDRHEFDAVFARYFGDTPPARAIVQSGFTDFELEVDAILVR